MLRSLLDLTRPGNCVIASVSVALGAVLARNSLVLGDVAMAMGAAACIGAAGNVLNDILDVEIDRLNRPERPLPNGQVSLPVAVTFGVILALGGVGLALPLGRVPLACAAGICALLILYDLWLKRTPIAGNVVVSMSAAATLPFGGVVAGAWHPSVVPALFAFLIHLAREVLKDVEDLDGDRLAGAETLAVRVGRYRALSIVMYLLFGLVALTPLPYLFGYYGEAYMRTACLVAAALIGVISSLHRNPFRTNLARMSSTLKGVMVLGILAIYLG